MPQIAASVFAIAFVLVVLLHALRRAPKALRAATDFTTDKLRICATGKFPSAAWRISGTAVDIHLPAPPPES